MDEINAEFVERYQLILEKDPRSKVFAPLSEAYRKLGLLAQALDICKQGVKYNPNFVSGLVAYAKVLIEIKSFEDAQEILLQATRFSPDNILAHRLLGQCHLQLRQAKKALASYKMVLFLNPEDAEAAKYVKKWESLTADEYEDELFDEHMKPVSLAHMADLEDGSGGQYDLVEKTLSLVDAFLVRNQIDSARDLLEVTSQSISHPEIDKRIKLLSKKYQEHSPSREIAPLPVFNPKFTMLMLKKQVLERLLQRIIVDERIDAKA